MPTIYAKNLNCTNHILYVYHIYSTHSFSLTIEIFMKKLAVTHINTADKNVIIYI